MQINVKNINKKNQEKMKNGFTLFVVDATPFIFSTVADSPQSFPSPSIMLASLFLFHSTIFSKTSLSKKHQPWFYFKNKKFFSQILERRRIRSNQSINSSSTPLHVTFLHGWINVANCLLEFGAVVNAQDSWKNTIRNRCFFVFDSFIFKSNCETEVLVLDFLNCLCLPRKDLRRVTWLNCWIRREDYLI